jgi:uncharacterized protein YdaU (DUF1376 family)
MHYYQFNIGDYQSHTSHLTEMEDLAYRRMIEWCYLHERALPVEIAEIGRLIRMRSHSDSIATVLREFFESTADGWSNARVVKEIVKFGEKSEKARRSAKSRWDANALPTQSEGNANQEPITKKQETKEKKQAVACPPDVDQKVWDDWVQLRKTKRAAVTQTVINSSRKEAELAGLSFEEFLTEWCLRGYQGLKAEWLLKEKQKAPAAPTKDWWVRGTV